MAVFEFDGVGALADGDGLRALVGGDGLAGDGEAGGVVAFDFDHEWAIAEDFDLALPGDAEVGGVWRGEGWKVDGGGGAGGEGRVF